MLEAINHKDVIDVLATFVHIEILLPLVVCFGIKVYPPIRSQSSAKSSFSYLHSITVGESSSQLLEVDLRTNL